MTIMQGDAYYLPFKLLVDKTEILPANVETIEFSLGNLLKYYPGDVEYRDECYQLYLSQQETFKLSPKSSAVRWQIRSMWRLAHLGRCCD